MFSAFDDAPSFHDEDFVGGHDGGEAVGDDEGGSSPGYRIELALDGLFCAGVQGGCGFIEDEDGGVFEECPGNGDSLFFSSGEFEAPFSNPAFVTFRQGGDEFIKLGGAGGCHDFFVAGIGTAVLDVVEQGVVEEDGILGDDSDGVSEAALGELADVLPVEGDTATCDVVKAEEQPGQGGFACA